MGAALPAANGLVALKPRISGITTDPRTCMMLRRTKLHGLADLQHLAN